MINQTSPAALISLDGPITVRMPTMLFANGVTKTVISARIGRRPGRGVVEVTPPVVDDTGKTVDLKVNPTDVFNLYEFEIPADIEVAVAGSDGQMTIVALDTEKRLRCAVRVPGMGAVYFLTEPPADSDGLEIERGAWIDIPPNVHAWPEGTKAPEQVLCRSKEDPKHYKLFKYRREIEGTDWEDTGLTFGGTFTSESWESFHKILESFQRIHAIAVEEGR